MKWSVELDLVIGREGQSAVSVEQRQAEVQRRRGGGGRGRRRRFGEAHSGDEAAHGGDLGRVEAEEAGAAARRD